MKTATILIVIIVIIVLILLITPAGQKFIKRLKGEEIDTSIPIDDLDIPPIDNSEPDSTVLQTPIKFNLPTFTFNSDLLNTPQGRSATDEEGENMLRNYISKAYDMVSVMKLTYFNITDDTVKQKAMRNGRTYKEEIADLLIRQLFKNTYPFVNIDDNAISPKVWMKYIQTPRNPQTCRPGMDISKLVKNSTYKDFTNKTNMCKEHMLISTI